jgi:cytochrome c biogenesis protein CcdA
VIADLAAVAPAASAVTLLATALLLGIRHGIDWDHIAAITDITSTTAAGEAGEELHIAEHRAGSPSHAHGGPAEATVHAAGAGVANAAASTALLRPTAGRLVLSRDRLFSEQRRAILLGTLYALGHASVVAVLGLLALLFGALLPDWVDPIMTRVVGVTLIILGIWVFYSVFAYFRHGAEFRLRSRWMLVFGSVRYAWRWFGAKLHGHDHVEPVEMSSYGPRTAFGVGMIHGVGAETGTQVLIIAAVGGAANVGLGIPMMVAFIVGLLISNSVIVLLTATGFVASQLRTRFYLVIGVLAGTFSLVVGALFLLDAQGVLPDLNQIFPFLGGT